MSALGQKQTLRRMRRMSALPPKADIAKRDHHVRFVPKADIGCLFDHFVGTGEYRMWKCDAQPLGGPSIDDQLQLGRHLYRQVARLLALEDARDVTCGTAASLLPTTLA